MIESFTVFSIKIDKLVTLVKTYLYNVDNNVFDIIDFYDDEIFLEPFLFSIINDKNKEEKYLNLLLFALSLQDKASVTSYTDSNGIIYLPKFGYLLTNIKNSNIILERQGKEIRLFSKENKEIVFSKKEIVKNDHNIEYLTFQNQLLLDFFLDPFDDSITDVEINEQEYNKHNQHFTDALNTIQKVYPEYYELIIRSLKKVVFYKGTPNSFASIKAHGIAFFNVVDNYNEIFFLDNIAHQCGHIIFHTLTLDKENLFNVSPHSRLSEVTGNPYHTGSIYGSFHGLFTQSNINICLSRCIEQNIFRGMKKLELIGRFSSNMQRFKIGIENFNHEAIYKPDGFKWFKLFKKTYENFYDKYADLIDSFDMSNQPYVFSFDRFYEQNKKKIEQLGLVK